MNAITRTYRGENDFDFPRTFKPLAIVSLILVVGSLISVLTQGLNLSIDFEGGSVWEVPSNTLTIDDARDAMEPFGPSAAEKFQEATTSDGVRVLRVSGRIDSIEESQDVAAALAEAADLPVTDIDVTTVGPSWGADITRTARNSLIIFSVLVTAYMAWRLEPRMAIAGIVAVLHDVILTVGFYSVFQFEVSPATVISFLTILGFSLYDTIVVFDRMQENATRLVRTGQYTYTAIARRSLNQVLMRSVNTSIVTLLPVATMLVVGQFIFGEPTLGDFSLALLVGLAAGAYSSLFVAAPLTVWLKEREPRNKELREKIIARGKDPDDTAWYGVRTLAPSGVAGSTERPSRRRTGGSPETAPPLTTQIGGHPPRPRKKRR